MSDPPSPAATTSGPQGRSAKYTAKPRKAKVSTKRSSVLSMNLPYGDATFRARAERPHEPVDEEVAGAEEEARPFPLGVCVAAAAPGDREDRHRDERCAEDGREGQEGRAHRELPLPVL